MAFCFPAFHTLASGKVQTPMCYRQSLVLVLPLQNSTFSEFKEIIETFMSAKNPGPSIYYSPESCDLGSIGGMLLHFPPFKSCLLLVAPVENLSREEG